MGDTDGAWVADYFSVVGARNDGDLELLDPESHSPEVLKCEWGDAITDVAVVRTGKGETCPEGYELIERTPMDYSADLNHGSVTSWSLKRSVHLAVRRQHVSKRDDYIAEMQVLYGDSEELPEGRGWELVENNASGKKANVNKGGDSVMLAVRRVVRDLVDCPAALCSVCVLLRNKGEHPPPGYRVIRKDLNRGKLGDVVQLAYQLGGALSMCRLPFRSMILDRYPEEDSPMFPFPGEQLPMFVHPKGMLLERRSGRDTPKSSFFSFVFTNVDGRRTYTACLTFYEPMAPSAARRLKRKLFTSVSESKDDSDTISADQATQGRMRISLRGSSSHPRLGTMSQTWSGVGSGGPNAWPRAFARSMGSSSGAMAPTSWTKLSVATRTPRYSFGHDPSPGQLSTTEIFSGPDAAKAPCEQGHHSPSASPRLSAALAMGNGSSADRRRWAGEVPFRDELEAGRGSPCTVDASREQKTEEGAPGVKVSAPTADATGSSRTSPARPSAVKVKKAAQLLAEDSTGSPLSDTEYDLKCQSEDRQCIFAPKTICVISRFPIYGVLRRFLRHLYAISLSRSGVPLERYISMFVSCIPMPPPGGCPFHVYLEPLENEDPRRSRLKPLTLLSPPDAWLPLMDIDFTAPFRCLSVQSVLVIFALMLQEAKIIFLSSRAELLTQVMEALRSLLFPMEWQSVYVPQLPYALAGYLECPGGFMIGMRLMKSELEKDSGSTATVVRDLGLDGVANAVNLDAGEVLLYSGQLADTVDVPTLGTRKATSHGCTSARGWRRRGHAHSEEERRYRSKSSCQGFGIFACGRGEKDAGPTESPLHPKDEETASPWLPEDLHAALASRLQQELFNEAGVRTGVEEILDQYESAFEFAPAPDRTDTLSTDGYNPQRMQSSSEHAKAVDGDENRCNQETSRHHTDCSAARATRDADVSLVIRDCFLCCMTELLGGICDSIRQSEAKYSSQTLRAKPLDELFNREAFLEGMNPDSRPFWQRLTSTQMFWVMIQQWLGTSSTTKQLLFFEECAMAVKNRRAGGVVPRKCGGRPSTEAGQLWSHASYILLAEEVYLKRPDLYNLNPLNLYWSSQLEGVRTTPAASPRAANRATPTTRVQLSGGIEVAPSLNLSAPNSNVRGVEDHPSAGSQEPAGSRILEENVEHERRQHPRDSVASNNHSALRSHNCHVNRGDPRPVSGDLSALVRATSGDASDVEGKVCEICTGPPVIIPGPTTEGLPERGEEHLYRYDDGWPTPLERSLLHTAPEALPPVVLKLQFHANPRSRHQFHGDETCSPVHPLQANNRCLSMEPLESSFSQGLNRTGRLSPLGPAQASTDARRQPGYRGERRLWRPHGRGQMVFRDGRVYNGEWRQGLQHGQGSMEYALGNVYTGSWRSGTINGQGTMTYPDGARYEGEWLEGQRHGHGTYTYASGSGYRGAWEHGLMHGKGCYTSANGTRYEGTYRQGRRCGSGRTTYCDGRRYVGNWADGVRDGFGASSSADGTVFEGHFKHGVKHGPGTSRRDDTGAVPQLWENGRLVDANEDN